MNRTPIGSGEEVELSSKDGRLMISPVRNPRAGWAEAAQCMAAEQNDELLDPDLTGRSEFDQQEWEWQ